jgi:hypothetical protein
VNEVKLGAACLSRKVYGDLERMLAHLREVQSDDDLHDDASVSVLERRACHAGIA